MPVALRGLSQAIREHRRHAARVRDLTPFLEARKAELEEMIERAWARQVSPGGERWPRRKRESEAAGKLRKSVRLWVEDGEIMFDVAIEHASYQFFGTSRVPARNPLPIEPKGGALEWMDRGEALEWLERMQEELAAYLTGAAS